MHHPEPLCGNGAWMKWDGDTCGSCKRGLSFAINEQLPALTFAEAVHRYLNPVPSVSLVRDVMPQYEAFMRAHNLEPNLGWVGCTYAAVKRAVRR